MRIALVNPPWHFENSIYFERREPHLPIELGACKSLLEQSGHRVLLVDGHLNRTRFGRRDCGVSSHDYSYSFPAAHAILAMRAARMA